MTSFGPFRSFLQNRKAPSGGLGNPQAPIAKSAASGPSVHEISAPPRLSYHLIYLSEIAAAKSMIQKLRSHFFSALVSRVR
jgi:hypothetical protein